MTLYTNSKNTSSDSTRIISVDEIGKIRPADWIDFFNRESTYSQSHEANESVLRTVHRHLKVKRPFALQRYTGNGSVAGSLQTGGYFGWLERKLRAGLAMLGANGTLFATFVTRGRIFRPPGYEKDNSQTWNPTQADYDAFDEWLYRCFGQDAERIVFAVVFDGNGLEDRQIEIRIGGNFSMMKKRTGKRISRKDSKRLKIEAESLASAGMNAGAIFRHFERLLEASVTLRAIRKWLKKAGQSGSCGRPVNNRNSGKKIGTPSHPQIAVAHNPERYESEVDSGQGCIESFSLPTTSTPGGLSNTDRVEAPQEPTIIQHLNTSQKALLAANEHKAGGRLKDIARKYGISSRIIQQAMKVPESDRWAIETGKVRVGKVIKANRFDGSESESAGNVYQRILSGTSAMDAIADVAALSGIGRWKLYKEVKKKVIEQEASAYVKQQIQDGKLDEERVFIALNLRRTGDIDDWHDSILNE